MVEDVRQIFKKFAAGSTIFKSKDVLQMSYVPPKLLHREKEIKQLAAILAPALRMEVPSNIFIYGRPGTGKTAVIRYVGDALSGVAREEGKPVEFVYVNAGLNSDANTPYKLYAELSTYFGRPVPHTGLSTSYVLETFIEAIDSEPRIVILVIDEIDKLSKMNEILYTLSRINSSLRYARVSLVGVSNKLHILKGVDARTRSSLSPEEIIFEPYNADQIRSILEERSREAFLEGAFEENVLSFCAAYSAKLHGDLRRALDLLRVAGEIAEREGSLRVSESHIKKAISQMEESKAVAIVRNLPIHSKLLLKSILDREDVIYTGEVYSSYRELAEEVGVKPISLRRVNDLLNDLESLGLITFQIVSRGRYGRTRVISSSIDIDIKGKVLTVLDDVL